MRRNGNASRRFYIHSSKANKAQGPENPESEGNGRWIRSKICMCANNEPSRMHCEEHRASHL
jgi:hypothetical protein